MLTHVTFTGNEAVSGGGMYLVHSAPLITNSAFVANSAASTLYYAGGGGLYVNSSSPRLDQVSLWGNTAYSAGGGIYLLGGSIRLVQVSLFQNAATGNANPIGGGIVLNDSSATLLQVAMVGNTAKGTSYNYGGALYVNDSALLATNTVIVYNSAATGGTVSDYKTNSESSTLTFTASALYNPTGFGVDNLTPDGTYLTVEPQFLAYADSTTGTTCMPGSSLTCLPDDLHLANASPLVNAGDVSMRDADDSPSDLGIYGGEAGADWDLDYDAVPDYFWPGEWADASSGFDPAGYDCDDWDVDVQGC